jgi:hypothetical protein
MDEGDAPDDDIGGGDTVDWEFEAPEWGAAGAPAASAPLPAAVGGGPRAGLAALAAGGGSWPPKRSRSFEPPRSTSRSGGKDDKRARRGASTRAPARP